MSWFRRHLHWTYVFGLIPAVVWLLSGAWVTEPGLSPLRGWALILAMTLYLSVTAWALKQKERSPLWALTVAVPLIGPFAIFLLGNEKEKRLRHAETGGPRESAAPDQQAMPSPGETVKSSVHHTHTPSSVLEGTKTWVRRHRIGTAIIVLIVVVSAVFFAVQYQSFQPANHWVSTVSSYPEEYRITLAKGQLLKLKLIMSVGDYGEEVMVVFHEAAQGASGAWFSGRVLEDYPSVSTGDIVRFRPPYSGPYILGIYSRSGNVVHVRVESNLANSVSRQQPPVALPDLGGAKLPGLGS